ncbi:MULTISPECIES: SRPBCC family protein [unclassified Ruegeria]|uniref:aromatic ring-hydroxylating oxygenase subunit alpha n=1 Tax=unclassified Ruegeria TaxID=2625375 RepID=UPI001488A01D|nr:MULTISPECIES: ring-hydroxylating oxygenase subunit alpha [unclassified Ruegeria]NOD76079.1 Rieske 2Fe-2S domain-containing protein [Ruegeria sp. HKCCD4332]NOD90038.1 Rieske 2Fe-2S domain-containing protein [Ruegeria sp. HKCCD4318]NOE15111.1 Rieske 2Fe-2S domain-containing protein [Ruegeria sp. HKCCD4318-2]NOG10678.1 Rieske 2Fe-2S domain-containing protein [Ruegeria sp. HKCCD4315]
MSQLPSKTQFERISDGFSTDPFNTSSLKAEAYVDPSWYQVDQNEVLAKTWQWVCHVEKLRAPGSYTTVEIAGRPIAVVRDREGTLRAFYNVCKHRAHHLLSGEGETTRIMCPYHAWVYKLDGQLVRAPETENLVNFKTSDICLDQVQVEEFAGFIYVNLNPNAAPLREVSGNLETEIRHWAPDIEQLTFGHRLTYDIKSNWKNVVDNFLECYHCPTAHKDFCDLVDMDTYKVTTYGIYSSHMAEAGKGANTAYDVSNATVRTHAVWWLWPTTCLMRYPGRSSMIVLNIIPIGPDRTLETYDFFLETPEPDEAELEAIRYLDEVLQREDIDIVESVQRGMNTPAFTQGRIVHDPNGSGKSEHAVHHFHGLVLDAYAKAAP